MADPDKQSTDPKPADPPGPVPEKRPGAANPPPPAPDPQPPDVVDDNRPADDRKVRAAALARDSLSARNPQQNLAVAEKAIRLAEQALAEDDGDLAVKLVPVARKAAAKANKPLLIAAAERLDQELTAAKPDLPGFKEGLEVLAKDPDNGEANLNVGRFRCVHQDAWEEGLPLLAKGSDEALQKLAKKDLAGPIDVAARKLLGDGWMAAAAKEKDKIAARQFLRRAYSWYKAALPQPNAISQADVQRQMGAIAGQLRDGRDPWGQLDVWEAKPERDYLHLDANACVFTRRWYRGGIDVTVVARTAKTNIRLAAGEGGLVIFNHEDDKGGIRVHRPDNPKCEGRGFTAGSEVGRAPDKLVPGQWYKLRWQLTPTGTKVWVEDKLVFEKEETFNLSAARPVAVCAHVFSGIDVKSIVVKTVPTAPKTNE
jgi:hypothetical protein